MNYQERALAIIDRLTDSKAINIRERGTLRRAILLPERPQGECENCDFRKFTETFVDGIVDVMNKNGITSVEQLSEILGGCADMRGKS